MTAALAVCAYEAGKIVAVAAASFTLAWTHSVEKTAWQEDWVATADGLTLEEARVKGSGAGVDPPAHAVLRQGWWEWRPRIPARPRLVLGASGATGEGWSICSVDGCTLVGGRPGEPVVVTVCDEAAHR